MVSKLVISLSIIQALFLTPGLSVYIPPEETCTLGEYSATYEIFFYGLESVDDYLGCGVNNNILERWTVFHQIWQFFLETTTTYELYDEKMNLVATYYSSTDNSTLYDANSTANGVPLDYGPYPFPGSLNIPCWIQPGIWFYRITNRLVSGCAHTPTLTCPEVSFWVDATNTDSRREFRTTDVMLGLKSVSENTKTFRSLPQFTHS